MGDRGTSIVMTKLRSVIAFRDGAKQKKGIAFSNSFAFFGFRFLAVGGGALCGEGGLPLLFFLGRLDLHWLRLVVSGIHLVIRHCDQAQRCASEARGLWPIARWLPGSGRGGRGAPGERSIVQGCRLILLWVHVPGHEKLISAGRPNTSPCRGATEPCRVPGLHPPHEGGVCGQVHAQIYGIIAIGALIGVALNLPHLDPITALYWTAVINILVAVPLLIVIMHMSGLRRVMGKTRPSRIVRGLGWLTTLVMALAAVGLLCTTFL